jgi:hypothetical protein
VSNDESTEPSGEDATDNSAGSEETNVAPERITLSQDTALAFAAEGLIDTYEIARDRQDANLMLKVTKLWLGMSTVLGSEGDGPHRHSKNKFGFTHHLQDDDVLESEIG